MADNHAFSELADELLLALEQEIRAETVEATHTAGVWIGTGLNIAASIIESRRIELICAGILSDAEVD